MTMINDKEGYQVCVIASAPLVVPDALDKVALCAVHHKSCRAERAGEVRVLLARAVCVFIFRHLTRERARVKGRGCAAQ